jgi:hypothetical protein
MEFPFPFSLPREIAKNGKIIGRPIQSSIDSLTLVHTIASHNRCWSS